MKTLLRKFGGTLAGPVLVTMGCASYEPHPDIVSLENRYEQSSARASAFGEAPTELQQAEQALQSARAADREGHDQDLQHELTLADTNLDIVDRRIDLHQTNEKIESATEVRQQLVLKARQRELARTEREAQIAQQKAEVRGLQLSAREEQLRLSQQEINEQERALAAKERALQASEQKAAKLSQELTELQSEVSDRGTVLTLSDIAFDFNSAEVKAGSLRTIEKIADYLKTMPERRIKIEGFTDAVGSENYNQTLSARRAQAVHDALVGYGVAADRIRHEGFGEAFPVATNDTAVGRAQNRRVEIIIANDDDVRISARS
ncbi:MAG: OmpA family protein [Pseudomonadales bacterium]